MTNTTTTAHTATAVYSVANHDGTRSMHLSLRNARVRMPGSTDTTRARAIIATKLGLPAHFITVEEVKYDG